MTAYTWTGSAGDGNFNNPANWSPSGVPGAADSVTIDTAAATTINAGNDAVGALTINSFTTLAVANNTSFSFGTAGTATTFANAGTFALNSGGNGTFLDVDASTLSLTGTGTVLLSNNNNNYIIGASASSELDNVGNKIEGAGNLGNGTLTFVNGSAGTVNANASNALFLNTGTVTATNAGLLESTSTGGLVIETTVNSGTAGKITAAGGNVYLQGGTLQGGTLASSGGAAIVVNTGGTLDGTAHTVTNDGTVAVNNNEALTLLGTITNAGTIGLNSGGNGTYLSIGSSSTASTVTLTGKGAVTLTDNNNNYITGGEAGDTLVNVNNTISGGGSFTSPLTLVNESVIDANATNNALVINTSATVTNTGTLESTLSGGAGLLINSVVSNNGGTVLASAGNVYLQNGSIEGGTIKTANGGAVYETANGTLDGSAHAVTNLGQVTIDNNQVLGLLGSIVNDGTITLNSVGNGTYLEADGPTVTLTGGGTILLSNNVNNYIIGEPGTNELDNVNNLIEGAGQIGGANPIDFVNGAAGVVDASASSTLYLNVGSTAATNAGLLEATGTGTLDIYNSTVTNSGTILAAGADVLLQSGIIDGGTLNSSGGGDIQAYGGTNEFNDGVTNLGSVVIDNNNDLFVSGTLTNKGIISLASGGNTTQFITNSATVTLTGGGTLSLSDNGNNYVQQNNAGETLDNINNLIEGSGQFGNGNLTVVNGAAGTISATGTYAQLVIDTGSNAFTNSGLIEADGPAGLYIYNTEIANGTAGIIMANGSNVDLNSATLQGGTLTAASGGVFVDVGNATLDASLEPLINDTTIDITNNTVLYAIGTLTNAGTLSLQSGGNTTQLIVGPNGTAGSFTLTGGGQITISDNNNNYIQAETSGDTLVNLNNTISGAGIIGNGDLIIVNDATIDATGTSNAMVLDPEGTMTNNALIEATGAAGLVIYNTTISNGSAGTITANGGGVTLQSATIQGGLLDGTATFAAISNSTLDGTAHTVTNQTTINIANNNTLYAVGTITNEGTIVVNSGGNTTELIVGPNGTTGTTTLTGGGHLVISDNNNNYIQAETTGDTLLNLNNTISGAGTLGNGDLIIINDATIDATGSNNALVLDPYGTMINNALIEATGSAGMDIYNTTVDGGTAGTISAVTNITLQSSTIEGGILIGAGGFSAISSATLDGITNAVVNKSSIVVENNNNAYLEGTINNQGTITLDSVGNTTELLLNSATVTLTGGGTLVISSNTNNYVQTTTTGDLLDNVNNTIEGGGNFGNGDMALTNSGVIEANDGTPLVVNLYGAVLNTSTGTFLASGGNMLLQGGTYTNDGVFQANDGSTLSFQNSAALTNDSATGTLTGGTYAAYANGHGATLSLAGTAVTTLDATVILSGAGAALSFGGTAIATDLATIDKSSALEVLNGANYTTTEKITNSGTIALGGGTLAVKSITDKSTALLTGFGLVDAVLISDGAIDATGLLTLEKTTTIAGTVSGTGTLDLDKGTTTLASGAVLDVSSIGLITGATLDLSTSLSFAGTFDITGKDANLIQGTGSLATSGLFEQNTTATTTVSAAYSSSGTVEVANGTLAFTGGFTNTGLILDKAALTDTAALTGGTLTVNGTSASASIATTGGAGNSTVALLNLEGGTLNTNGTTLTVTSNYTNTETGTGNSYNPLAGVTGTIDGQGAALAVVGVDGTHITTVNGTLTITINPGGTASFEIENTGAAGSAEVSGALQTSVNGGNITSPGLTGSGVTAANFAAIAAGKHSSVYTIDYSGGSLTGQAIHLISDFANVAGLTIDIVAGTGNAAPAAMAGGMPHEEAPSLPWLHIAGGHYG
jgi:hypothetical protein